MSDASPPLQGRVIAAGQEASLGCRLWASSISRQEAEIGQSENKKLQQTKLTQVRDNACHLADDRCDCFSYKFDRRVVGEIKEIVATDPDHGNRSVIEPGIGFAELVHLLKKIRSGVAVVDGSRTPIGVV